MVTRDKAELINEIIDLQRRITRFMRDDSPDVWLSLNLTIAQLKALLFINFEGKTNFKALACALGTTPPVVTGIVDRMQEQGLISREENPENRRMQMLKLTEKGDTLIKELQERGTTRLSRILMLLSTEDLSMLAQGLTALNRVVEK